LVAILSVTAFFPLPNNNNEQARQLYAPLALSRTSAKNYAENWAMGRNSNYKSFSSDCTNFASQTIGPEGGGYAMQYTSPKWFMQKKWWGWRWTNSWSVVGNFRSLLYARGWGEWWGYQNPGTSNSAWYGDILGYDWTGDGIWDHASIEVAYTGCDPVSGWCGDLVDQHTTDRYHAFWTLQPYNPNWQTTRIGLWHVKY